jgi:AcrR family transcriptional regulator
VSLRHRKKEKLRRTIMETAGRLFLSRGYERTTLEQVCAQAETSLRTLLRYFPTKEDLALGYETMVLKEFTDALAARAPGTPVISFWREFLKKHAHEQDRKEYLAHMKFLNTVPAVAAKTLALQFEYEDMLAKAFAREAGVDPDRDTYGRLLAGMLIAGSRAAGRKWVASEGKLNLLKLRTDVVDWALAHFPARAATQQTSANAVRKHATRRKMAVTGS